MPYLARGHLGQRDFTQRRHRDDHARVRAILRALLAALDYAHARGVVHRDVKAENVLFDEAERPLLADFGIALRKRLRPARHHRRPGRRQHRLHGAGTGARRGRRRRADLYSVGVLAWEMLTGQLPYMAGDALSMAVMHAQDPIPRLPRPLRHWQRFIDRALAKSPAQRFRSAQQMREALDARAAPQRPAGCRARANACRDARRRDPALAEDGAWIAVLLVVAAGIGLALRQWRAAGPTSFFRAHRRPTTRLADARRAAGPVRRRRSPTRDAAAVADIAGRALGRRRRAATARSTT